MRVLLAIVATLFLASGLTAQDMSTLNYSTDKKLLSEVKTRMVLENGLVINIWGWNEKAKELGLDKHPNAGLTAQDVEHMFPEAVIEDENVIRCWTCLCSVSYTHLTLPTKRIV